MYVYAAFILCVVSTTIFQHKKWMTSTYQWNRFQCSSHWCRDGSYRRRAQGPIRSPVWWRLVCDLSILARVALHCKILNFKFMAILTSWHGLSLFISSETYPSLHMARDLFPQLDICPACRSKNPPRTLSWYPPAGSHVPCRYYSCNYAMGEETSSAFRKLLKSTRVCQLGSSHGLDPTPVNF